MYAKRVLFALSICEEMLDSGKSDKMIKKKKISGKVDKPALTTDSIFSSLLKKELPQYGNEFF